MGHKLNGVFISETHAETSALSCTGSAFGPSTWTTALVPPPPPHAPRDALASSPPPRGHRLRGGRGASPTSASASGASHLPDSNARCDDFLRSSSMSPPRLTSCAMAATESALIALPPRRSDAGCLAFSRW